MSESEKEGTTVVSRGVDGLDHDADDDDRGSTERKKKKQKRQRRGCGCGGDFSKVKVVDLIPYAKAKKLLIRRRTDSNKKPSSSSSSSCSANADGSAKSVNDCCVCFKRPSTLESPAESITSDPNDPNFTFDMLRTLIENNDFFSKECNPHLDSTRSSFSSDNSWAK